MTAKGKINASNLTTNDRIIVNTNSGAYEGDSIRPSATKTGEGVVIVRVLDKLKCSNRRGYMVVTSAGQFYAEPIQTMWLAPEDNAGVKRAHVEALEENKRRDREATPAEVEAATTGADQAAAIRDAAEAARTAPTQAEAAEIMAAAMGLPAEALADWAAANWTAPAPEEAPELTDEERARVYNDATGTDYASAEHPARTGRCENGWHASAPVRALILCPECPPAAPAAGAAPAAQVVARPTSSRALALQMAGRALRMPEPLAFIDLPPVAAGKELVRLADIAPSFLLTLHSQAGKVGPNSEDDLEEPDMNATATAETPTTEAEKAAKRDHTGSTIVALIERVWDRIRTEHPELPAVVVTTGSGEFVKWGHFRPNSWKTVDGEKRHEFFLASEALAKGAHQVLQTTIHEAAHTLSNVRGVKDTSRQHRYHNGTFRKTAEELGLEHKASTPDKTHGFSFVTLTEATKVKYADLLAELEKELTLTGMLPFWLGGDSDEDERGGEKIAKPKGGTEEGEGETKPQSGNLKATCGCEEPIIIRLSRKVLDLGVVRCDQCSELFTAA